MAERSLPKPDTRVRFPSAAPRITAPASHRGGDASDHAHRRHSGVPPSSTIESAPETPRVDTGKDGGPRRRRGHNLLVELSRTKVRPARPEDVPRLREIFRRAAWSNVEDRPLFAEHPEFLEWSGDAARSGRTRVGAVDGEVAGFVSTVTSGDVVEIEDLFVDPTWMRAGVATALIGDAVATARRAGCSQLAVDGNEHALAFYRSVGFVVEREVALEHGTAIRMHLDVQP